jgi:DNA-binding transcriptional LysR family regulator
MADEIIVVVGAEHPWATRRSVSMDELKVEPMILRERGSGSRETFERALEEVGLDLGAFRIVGEIASTQAIKQAVRAGVGISLISRRAVQDECRARLLCCVSIRDLTISRAFHLVTHRDRSRSPLAQAFLAFVESSAARA